jgi:hypothetical protein
MADAGIKQVRLQNTELPYVQFNTKYNPSTLRDEIDKLYYNIRYRIVSDDKNRVSHWSPINKIIMPELTSPFPYTSATRFSIEKSGGHVNVIWSFPQESENPSTFERVIKQINVFDIWVRWNTSNTTNPAHPGWTPWEFETTVSSNVWSVFPPAGFGYKSINVAIQVPTVVKLRDYNNNKLTIFTGIKDAL